MDSSKRCHITSQATSTLLVHHEMHASCTRTLHTIHRLYPTASIICLNFFELKITRAFRQENNATKSFTPHEEQRPKRSTTMILREQYIKFSYWCSQQETSCSLLSFIEQEYQHGNSIIFIGWTKRPFFGRELLSFASISFAEQKNCSQLELTADRAAWNDVQGARTTTSMLCSSRGVQVSYHRIASSRKNFASRIMVLQGQGKSN